MKQILLVLTIGLALWVRPVAAQDAAHQAVIAAQIEAFQVDDFVRAFSYASPTIQTVFRNPENFAAMVKRGYPMVWRTRDVRYLEARMVAGKRWQKLLVIDAKGARFLMDYRMIETGGLWKIDAVQMLELPEVAA
ncbi:DUF4864 domain-containing protein [Lentibacter sp.]|uniref:DUF4864 domain-containing protein n=1 Tax=Lentibacter sp. TaxID=2024994 RepID=UPI003F69D519